MAELFDTIRRDIRHAVRGLALAPSFTLTALASLALAIGANTTMFSVLNAVLLRPLVSTRGEFVRIGRTTGSAPQFRSLDYDELRYLRDNASSLSAVAGEAMETAIVTGPGDTEATAIELVTGNYFATLRALPAIGRGFTDQDDEWPGSGPQVVLSHAFWRRRYGHDSSIVGSSIEVNGNRFTVVGVAPAGFTGTFPGVAINLWMPASMAGVLRHRPSDGSIAFQVIARVSNNATLSDVRADLAVASARLTGDTPRTGPRRAFVAAPATGVHPAFARPLRSLLTIFMVVGTLVLLIGCANVASLLLARAVARGPEFAIRVSMGATRSRIVGQLCIESGVLAVAAGTAGALLALWPVRLMNALLAVPGPAGAPTSLDLAIDGRVIGFTGTVTMATVLLFGLVPAVRATRADRLSIRHTMSAGRDRSRLQSVLLVSQVAVSFVFLTGLTLLTRSLHNTRSIGVGFDPDGVVVASFNGLSSLGFTGVRSNQFHAAWLDRARGMPGVRHAALADFVPFVKPAASITVLTTDDLGDAITAYSGHVSRDYFATLNQPLARGRDFTDSEAALAAPVAIVNESAARRLRAPEDIVGSLIRVATEDTTTYTIIGVARDAKFASFGGDVEPFVFLPASRITGTLYVQGSMGASPTLSALNRIAHELEATLPPLEGQTMRTAMGGSLVALRIIRAVLGGAALVAIGLVGSGLFGLIAYTMERQRKEIGIRIALGASRLNVFRVLVGGAARVTALGVVLGSLAGFGALRFLSSLLYGLTAVDPVSFIGVACFLLLVTLTAGLAAAGRGLRVDPVVALRTE